MSHNEVEMLRRELQELKERVIKLETYIKVAGTLASLVPIALQIYNMFRK